MTALCSPKLRACSIYGSGMVAVRSRSAQTSPELSGLPSFTSTISSSASLAELEDIFRRVSRVSASHVVALRSVERRAVIVYRIVGETVEITNVFYGGRDDAALYRRGKTDDGA